MKSQYQANITQFRKFIPIYKYQIAEIVYEQKELLKYYTSMLLASGIRIARCRREQLGFDVVALVEMI